MYLPCPLAADQGRCQNVHFEEEAGRAPDQAVRNALLLLHCKLESRFDPQHLSRHPDPADHKGMMLITPPMGL